MSTTSRRPTTFAPLAALALLAIGCGSGGPVDDFITASLFVPPKGDVSDKQLTVPKGRALAFVAQPMGDGETLKERVTLSSRDSSVADVEQTVEMNQFVVVGVSVGTTELTAKDESGTTASVTLRVQVVEP